MKISHFQRKQNASNFRNVSKLLPRVVRRTSQLRSKTLCKQLSGFLSAITRSLNPLTVDYVKQVANKRPRLHAPTIDNAFQIIVLFPSLPCSDLV